MKLKTSDINSIKPFIKHLYIPKPNSHKGQNGKVLIVGGSSLFHSASIWAAEVASRFVDMVHYSSTAENNEIFLSLKKKFRNGIIAKREDLSHYAGEDDVVLIGPGMMRKKITNFQFPISNKFDFKTVLNIKEEGEYTYFLTKYLLENFPNKKFVIDAGALQMMDPNWLLKLKTKPILTPHGGEFKRLFGIDLSKAKDEVISATVKKLAKRYKCVILLKSSEDFISDGEGAFTVEGGNAGLTKGGTGDILAGVCASIYAKSTPLESAVLSSYILKKTADELFKTKEYWYNIDDIIESIPATLKKLKE